MSSIQDHGWNLTSTVLVPSFGSLNCISLNCSICHKISLPPVYAPLGSNGVFRELNRWFVRAPRSPVVRGNDSKAGICKRHNSLPELELWLRKSMQKQNSSLVPMLWRW